MLTRNPRVLLALALVVGLARADYSWAQGRASLEAPLQLASLEWWVASNDVIVRGVVVDVTPDEIWNIVTVDVKETLKGTRTERVKFVVHKFDTGDALLAESKKSQREQLWVLKRQDAAAAGEAPHREKIMARHKVTLHAPFVPGRPGEPDLPVLALENINAESKIKFLTLDLKVLSTTDQLVKAIRATIAAGGNVCDCESEPLRSYAVALPKEIAEQTGFSRNQNQLVGPLDSRMEELCRKLVLTPGNFLTFAGSDTQANRQLLRLEGVKALRQMPSEKNMSVIRAWLDNPMTNDHYNGSAGLVPAAPQTAAAVRPELPTELTRVPEINFQQPLTKAMNTQDAQLHTAVNIDNVNLLNKKKTDAFIETMMQKRPDLAGLSFAMGEKCRMKEDAGRKFAAALDLYRKFEATSAGGGSDRPGPRPVQVYVIEAAAKNIDPAASVATLMQVLGHEDAQTRLELVQYLGTLSCSESTKALARMAIFSQEADIRAVAVKSLKLRRDTDYTDVLVSGLKYPWPQVAEAASDAIAQLGRKDLIGNLIEVLEKPDPRAPQVQDVAGKKVTVVRELVRLNHHHNCLLCHAPAPVPQKSEEPSKALEGLTAQVPVPSEAMVAYYRPSVPDILVRFDVTYLRQDFSMKIAVPNADPWPQMQRYDFLVRTREVTDNEASAYRELLNRPEASPYRRAAEAALRQLTGRNEPNAQAWRKSTGL